MCMSRVSAGCCDGLCLTGQTFVAVCCLLSAVDCLPSAFNCQLSALCCLSGNPAWHLPHRVRTDAGQHRPPGREGEPAHSQLFKGAGLRGLLSLSTYPRTAGVSFGTYSHVWAASQRLGGPSAAVDCCPSAGGGWCIACTQPQLASVPGESHTHAHKKPC